ncbi:MAG TPA: DUF5671 domain-containing protein [Anaerolineales bacterium]|nr:DUF5671 domain-containing protein [Anaerolineales bacterium]
MRTARRVYLYAVSFISLQAVMWSAIGAGRLALDLREARADFALFLPAYLSAFIVGLPFLLIHWLTAQRLASKDSEERSAAFRAFFHFAVLTSAAIPALLTLLEAIQHLASLALGVADPWSFFGPTRPLPGQLLEMAISGGVWLFAWRLAAADARAIPEAGTRASLHRLYRYLMTAFGLALTASAAGMFLYMLLGSRTESASAMADRLALGLAQAAVGAPLWVISWRIVQRAYASGGEETESTIRKVYLYITCLVGSLGVMVAGAGVLTLLLQRALGVSQGEGPWTSWLGRPVTVIVVGAAVWAYHARVLGTEARPGTQAAVPGAEIRETYHYLVAALGLGATVIGALFLADTLSGAVAGAWLPGMRIPLSNGLATLAAGVPVWLASWGRMQRLALQSGEAGEVARRSVVRRGYLYLFALAGAIGLLASLAALVNLLLSLLLGGEADAPLTTACRPALNALLFSAVLGYSLHTIRADVRRERRSRAEVLADFPIALVGPEAWTARFRATLNHSLPGVSLHEHLSEDLSAALNDSRAVLFPASLLASWPEPDRARLSAYGGLRLPVPENEPQWGWVGLVDRSQAWQAEQAARAIELAAFGQPVRSPKAISPWAIAGGVLLLVILIPLAISLIFALVSLAGIE